MKLLLNLAAVILALAATFTIAACAGLADPYWTTTKAYYPTSITVRYTDDMTPCGNMPHTLGCATRVDDGVFRNCFVLIKKGMSEARTTCVLRHEVLAHCIEGRDHVDVATNECGVTNG